MKAWQLMDSADKWTQLTWARDKTGVPVDWNSDTATCWCLFGALKKCYGSDTSKYSEHILSLWTELDSVTDWNDTHTYEEVVAILKELDI